MPCRDEPNAVWDCAETLVGPGSSPGTDAGGRPDPGTAHVDCVPGEIVPPCTCSGSGGSSLVCGPSGKVPACLCE